MSELTDATDLAPIPSNLELRHALATEEQTRSEITAAIAQIAQALEDAAPSLRRELAWLFPNLGAHQPTHAAIAWTTSKDAVTRLLTKELAPA
jgi:hypothetical protein